MGRSSSAEMFFGYFHKKLHLRFQLGGRNAPLSFISCIATWIEWVTNFLKRETTEKDTTTGILRQWENLPWIFPKVNNTKLSTKNNKNCDQILLNDRWISENDKNTKFFASLLFYPISKSIFKGTRIILMGCLLTLQRPMLPLYWNQSS